MFQGETAITVDDKGRMAVPTAYRELVARACGNRLVLTYNPFEKGCLWLYAQAEWERVRDDVMARPILFCSVRVLQQKLVGSSAMLELDGHAARVMQREHGFMVPRDLRGEARVYGVLLSKDLSEASDKYAKEHPGEENPVPEQEYRIDALGIVMVE